MQDIDIKSWIVIKLLESADVKKPHRWPRMLSAGGFGKSTTISGVNFTIHAGC